MSNNYPMMPRGSIRVKPAMIGCYAVTFEGRALRAVSSAKVCSAITIREEPSLTKHS